MLYKFKTRNAGDVIMTGPVGDRVLEAAGRDPSPKGIFEPAAMPAAIAALESAIAAEDAARKATGEPAADGAEPADEGTSKSGALSLRQRAWPLLEMLRRAQADGEPVVWGV